MNKVARNMTIGTLTVMLLIGAAAMWYQTLGAVVTVNTGRVDIGFISPIIYLDACGLQPGYGMSGGYDWNASGFPDKTGYEQPVVDAKDVGCTNVTVEDTDGDGDNDLMTVNLYNVYPWYYSHIDFNVMNTGTVPIKIWRIIVVSPDGNRTYYEINAEGVEHGVPLDLNNDGHADVVMWWGDNFGKQLHPGETAAISFDLTVLQEAPQNANLSFSIILQAVQWNEYSVPTTPSTW